MDNNVYIYFSISSLLHHYPYIIFATSLSTADLIFSEYNYIYPTASGISYSVLRIIIQALDKNWYYTIIQPLVKFNCLYKIIQVWFFNLTNIYIAGFSIVPIVDFWIL